MIEAFISRSDSTVKATGNAVQMAAETCYIAEVIFFKLREDDVTTAAVYLASVAKGLELVCERARKERR